MWGSWCIYADWGGGGGVDGIQQHWRSYVHLRVTCVLWQRRPAKSISSGSGGSRACNVWSDVLQGAVGAQWAGPPGVHLAPGKIFFAIEEPSCHEQQCAQTCSHAVPGRQ
jgi:hypothetical protein